VAKKLTRLAKLRRAKAAEREQTTTLDELAAAITKESRKRLPDYELIDLYHEQGEMAERALKNAQGRVRRFSKRRPKVRKAPTPAVKPTPERKPAPLAEVFEPTGTAVEFKADYESGKPKDDAHLNVRITKTNGGRMTMTEAKWVAEQFLKRRGVPSGYEVRAISWQSGKALRAGTWKVGTPPSDAVKDLRALIGAAQLDFNPGLVEEG
jgi:hypothetical protein